MTPKSEAVAQNIQQMVIDIDKDLFPLTEPYTQTETLPVMFYGKPINLYPTKNVMKMIKEYRDQNTAAYDLNPKSIELVEKLQDALKQKKLDVADDTTIYYPKLLQNHLEVVVDKKINQLFRDDSHIKNKKYMFVLSKKNRLFAAEKMQGVYGRVHHSSLARGKPVRTAGSITVQELENGSQKILITNGSGHYKPTPASLDKILKWLEDKGFMFKKIEDIVEDKKEMGMIRSVVLITQPNKN